LRAGGLHPAARVAEEAGRWDDRNAAAIAARLMTSLPGCALEMTSQDMGEAEETLDVDYAGGRARHRLSNFVMTARLTGYTLPW
jgi:hypothetical protein